MPVTRDGNSNRFMAQARLHADIAVEKEMIHDFTQWCDAIRPSISESRDAFREVLTILYQAYKEQGRDIAQDIDPLKRIEHRLAHHIDDRASVLYEKMEAMERVLNHLSEQRPVFVARSDSPFADTTIVSDDDFDEGNKPLPDAFVESFANQFALWDE